MHVAAAAEEAELDTQGVQVVARTSLNELARHGRHGPPLAVYVPAAHGVHESVAPVPDTA